MFCIPRFLNRLVLSSLMTMAVFAGPLSTVAHGVIISQGSNTPNLRAPGNDPGWNNVGIVAGGSGVYLGNRWVITAHHVGPGSLQLSDGRVFDVSNGSQVQLQNPSAVLGLPDLRLFRLAEDPGLPTPLIAATPPLPGAVVTMIGAGLTRSPSIQGWAITQTATGLDWRDAPLPVSSAEGYTLTDQRQMQWGTNTVTALHTFDSVQHTVVFSTRYDRQGQIFEGQATTGDSGGGVFEERAGEWNLAGIMISTVPLTGQPDNTVVFGNQTSIASLAPYRDQILALLATPDRPWQNQFNQFDVSRSGNVDPRDVLVIINQLLQSGEHALSGLPGANDPLVDTNGDGRLSPTDALRVINAIKSGEANPIVTPQVALSASNFSSSSHLVPEPSTLVLAGGAAALMALAAAKRRHRQQIAKR